MNAKKAILALLASFSFLCGWFTPQSQSDGVLTQRVRAEEKPKEYHYGLLGRSYDVAGALSASDPDGNPLDLAKGSIDLLISHGQYAITYPNRIDYVKVYETKPEDSVTFSQPIPSSARVGESIVLPRARIESGIVRSDKSIPPVGVYEDYRVEIYEDGEYLRTISPEDLGREYAFEEPGLFAFDYVYTDAFSDRMSVRCLVEVIDAPAIIVKGIPSSMNLEESVSLTGVYAYCAGARYGVEKSYTSPSGEKGPLSASFQPRELGDYVLAFSASIEGEAVSKKVTVSVADGGTALIQSRMGLGGVSVAQNKVPSSVKTTHSSGLSVNFHDANASFLYGKIIDLSAMEGKDLVEFVPNPYSQEAEVQEIVFTLTDCYDASNAIGVRFRKNDIFPHQTLVYAVNSGISYGETRDPNGNFLVDSHGEAVAWGFGVNWAGAMQPNGNADAAMIGLNFSYELSTNSLYMRTQTNDFASGKRIRLADLDDDEHFSFRGFTAKEVYLSCRVSSGTGDVLFTEIAGEAVDKVDESSFSGNESILLGKRDMDALPEGVVNVPYPLPEAYAKNLFGDDFSAEISLAKGGIDCTGLIQGGSFLPQESGDYSLTYSLRNQYGVLVRKSGFFHVALERTPMKISASLPEQAIRRMGYFTIPSVSVTGGHGEVSVSLCLIHGGASDPVKPGDVVQLNDEADYSLRAVAKDFLGFSDVQDFPIAVDDDFLYWSLADFPRAVDKGEEFAIPTPIARDFSRKEDASVEVAVDGRIYAPGDKVSFAETGEREVIYTVAKGSEKEAVYSYRLPVLDPASEPQDLASYFLSDDGVAEVSKTSAGARFLYQKGGDKDMAEIRLPYLLSNNDLAISFNLLDQEKNFRSVAFTLTGTNGKSVSFGVDNVYYSPAERPELTQGGLPTGTYLPKNQGEYSSGDFEGEKYRRFYLNFDAPHRKVANAAYETIARLARYDDGTPFGGFPKGGCYLTITLSGIRGSGSFFLDTLQNQSFTTTALARGDRIAPNLGMESPLAKNNYLRQSSRVSIPEAGAYDFFCHTSSITMSCQSPRGAMLYQNSGPVAFTLPLDEPGQYLLRYQMKDKAGRGGEVSYSFHARNKIAPTIELEGSYEAAYGLGEEITILGASVSDDLSSFERGDLLYGVYVHQPDGYRKSVQVGEKYAFVQTGTHRIRYVAMDGDGNQRTLEFVIQVESREGKR